MTKANFIASPPKNPALRNGYNTGVSCSECGAPVENDAPRCLACGTVFEAVPASREHLQQKSGVTRITGISVHYIGAGI